MELGPRVARHHRSRTRTSRCGGQECAHGVSPGFSDCQSRGWRRTVHRPRRSAARSSFRCGSDLGWVMRHAVQAPPARRAITQGQRRRRGSPLMTRSRCRRRLASAGSPSKWSSSAMTIIPTGGTGARARWARGWKTHRDRDCNGCRARRRPSLVSGPRPLEGRQPPPSLAVMNHCEEQGEGAS